MSARPDDRAAEPFWTVQPVYDPDGGGADFAYTIGLSGRGFPELHVWARPSLGDDPGLDWKLSIRDCCAVLHEFAALLLNGDLDVGSTLRHEYDGGLAVVEYRVDPPGDREQLEAYGVPDGAEVLPVRWSLSRPPAGPALPLAETEVRRARRRYDDLLSRLGTPSELSKGWELPDRPSFEVDQRLGPLTPLVLARAAHMSQVDAQTLTNFLYISVDVEQAMNPTWPLVRARALGRPAGRGPALDNLHGAVEELMDLWSRQRRQRKRWTSIIEEFVAGAPEEYRWVPRSRVDANLRHVLQTAIASCLAGELVYDVADNELRLMAAGAWECATSRDCRPGAEWHAPEDVLTRIRTLLEDLTAHDLAMLAARHRDALAPVPVHSSGTQAYGDLVSRMLGFAVTSAAMCPPAVEVVDPALRPILVSRWIVDAVKGTGRTRYALDEWLTCLAVVLVHRAHFTAEQVRAFAAPVEDVLPGLETLVNEPL